MSLGTNANCHGARSGADNAGRCVRWLLVGVILLGTGLIFHDLGRGSLWMDEIIQAQVSSLSLSEIIVDVMKKRGQPPLFWLLLHFVMPLGRSEFSVRLLSAMFGVINIAVVYKLGEVLLGRWEAIVAAFLLAIAPLHLEYAQDARMYTALVCFSLLSLYWLYRAMEENRLRQWTGFVIFATLNLWNHTYAAFPFAAEVAFGGLWLVRGLFAGRKEETPLREGRKRLRGFLASTAIVIVAWTPVLMGLRRLAQRVGLGAGGGLDRLPTDLSSLVQLGAQFAGGNSALLSALAVLLVAGLVACLAGHRKQILLLTLWVAAPAVGFYVMKSEKGWFTVRYVIFLLPLFLLFISKGLVAGSKLIAASVRWGGFARFRPAIAVSLTCLPLLFVTAMTVPTIQAQYRLQKDNFEGLARFLQREVRPDDRVLLFGGDVEPYDYYYDDRFGNLQRAAASVPGLQKVVSRHPRTWIVARHLNMHRVAAPVGSWVEKHFAQVPFSGFTIYLLECSSGTCQAYREGLSLVSSGDKLRKEGATDEAVSRYREALDLAPDLFAAHLGLAEAYRDMAMLEEAMVEFQEVVQLDPANSKHYLALAELLEARGRLDEAAAMRRAAEQPKVENWGTCLERAGDHVARGDVYMDQGETEAAVKEYQQALEISQNLARAHLGLADARREQARAHEATEGYYRALELNPEWGEEVWFLMRLANAHREAGQVEKATETYKRVLVLNPEHAAARNWVEELCP